MGVLGGCAFSYERGTPVDPKPLNTKQNKNTDPLLKLNPQRSNTKHQTPNAEHQTPNNKHQNPKPKAPHPKPLTLPNPNPKPQNSKLKIQNPKPRTQNPKPKPQNPTNPKPQTQKPQTKNPKWIFKRRIERNQTPNAKTQLAAIHGVAAGAPPEPGALCRPGEPGFHPLHPSPHTPKSQKHSVVSGNQV